MRRGRCFEGLGFVVLAVTACGGKSPGMVVDAAVALDNGRAPDAALVADSRPIPDAQVFDAAHYDAAPGQLALGALSVDLGTGGSAIGPVLRAQDQGLLVAGYAGTTGFLLHLADDGASVWQMSYPAARPLHVAQRGTGYIIGGTYSNSDPWIAGVDADGAMAWQEVIGTTVTSVGGVADIVASADGSRTFVLGQAIGPSTNRSFEVVEVGASGAFVSDTAFTSLDPVEVHDLALLDDGSFAVAGALEGADYDALVARVTTTGVTWQQRFDHDGGNEHAFAVLRRPRMAPCAWWARRRMPAHLRRTSGPPSSPARPAR